MRARSHAAAILKRLDRLKHDYPGFRYRAVDFNPLAETPLVRDLVSLTLALQQPADRLAWLSVLRAPLVGLDLADIDRLAGGDAEGLIEDALATVATGLSNDGRAHLERTAPLLLESSRLRGRAPIRAVVESCWQHLGGPACIHNGSELDDAETYFALLEQLDDLLEDERYADQGQLRQYQENQREESPPAVFPQEWHNRPEAAPGEVVTYCLTLRDAVTAHQWGLSNRLNMRRIIPVRYSDSVENSHGGSEQIS